MGGDTVVENCRFTDSKVVAALYQYGSRLDVQRSTLDVDAAPVGIDTGAGIVARDGAELTMWDNCFVGGSYEFPVVVSEDVVVMQTNAFLSSNYLTKDIDANCTGLHTAGSVCFETEDECPGICTDLSATACSADRPTQKAKPFLESNDCNCGDSDQQQNDRCTIINRGRSAPRKVIDILSVFFDEHGSYMHVMSCPSAAWRILLGEMKATLT